MSRGPGAARGTSAAARISYKGILVALAAEGVRTTGSASAISGAGYGASVISIAVGISGLVARGRGRAGRARRSSGGRCARSGSGR